MAVGTHHREVVECADSLMLECVQGLDMVALAKTITEMMEANLLAKNRGTLKGVWAPHNTRDEIVDNIGYWTERTEVPARQLLEWHHSCTNKSLLPTVQRKAGTPARITQTGVHPTGLPGNHRRSTPTRGQRCGPIQHSTAPQCDWLRDTSRQTQWARTTDL